MQHVSLCLSLSLICATASACRPMIHRCWIIDVLFIDLWRASSERPGFVSPRCSFILSSSTGGSAWFVSSSSPVVLSPSLVYLLLRCSAGFPSWPWSCPLSRVLSWCVVAPLSVVSQGVVFACTLYEMSGLRRWSLVLISTDPESDYCSTERSLNLIYYKPFVLSVSTFGFVAWNISATVGWMPQVSGWIQPVLLILWLSLTRQCPSTDTPPSMSEFRAMWERAKSISSEVRVRVRVCRNSGLVLWRREEMKLCTWQSLIHTHSLCFALSHQCFWKVGASSSAPTSEEVFLSVTFNVAAASQSVIIVALVLCDNTDVSSMFWLLRLLVHVPTPSVFVDPLQSLSFHFGRFF